MEKITRFFKTAGIYLMGNVFTKLVSFVLLPLYTSIIDPVAYGKFGLSITIFNVIVPIVYFSIWDSVFRFAFDYKEEKDKYKVLNNGFFVMLLGSAVLLAGEFLVGAAIHFEHPVLYYLYISAMGFQSFYTIVARALRDNNLFVFSGCVNSVLFIILNIILILIFGMGIDALYLSFIVGVIVQVAIIESKKRLMTKISLRRAEPPAIKRYILFSIPVTVAAISNWLLNGLTQVIITYRLGNYYNGLYNVANKFSSILTLGIGVFQFAWNEMAYDLANDTDRMKYYRKSISEILRLSVIGVSLLILAVKIIYPFMVADRYRESLGVIPILLVGTMAHSYGNFLGTLFMADKKSLSLFTTTLFAGIINFVGLNILIPIGGFYGAVFSLFLAFTAYATARVCLLKKEMNIVPDLYSIYPMAVLVAAIAAFYMVDSTVYLIGIIVVLAGVSMIMSRDLIAFVLAIIKKGKH